MNDFENVDNKYFHSKMVIDGKPTSICVNIYRLPEEVNWKVANEIIDLIITNIKEHKEKAATFMHFLVRESKLYDADTINKIQGFELVSIELTQCFGKYAQTMYETYKLYFDFISDFHVDTYGRLIVTFMNRCVIGVERKQV